MSGDILDYLAIVLGVLIAVVLPVLSKAVWNSFRPKTQIDLKKYAILFAFASLTGLLVLAFYRQNSSAVMGFWTALLAGYTYEATLEKIVV